MTPDEIVASLNEKFFVASVTDDGFTVYTRVFWQDEIDCGLCCQSFKDFRRRFPRKQLIENKTQNTGAFWLSHPKRRTLDQIIYRERFERKE